MDGMEAVGFSSLVFLAEPPGYRAKLQEDLGNSAKS